MLMHSQHLQTTEFYVSCFVQDVNLIPNSLLCRMCHAQLTTAYTFRTRCATTETELSNYLDKSGEVDDVDDVLDRVAELRSERTKIIDLTSSSEDDDDDDVLFLGNSTVSEMDIIDHVNMLVRRVLKRKVDDDSDESVKKVPPLKIKVPGTYEAAGSYVCDLCPKRCPSKFAMYEHYQVHWNRKKRRKSARNSENETNESSDGKYH